MSRSTGPWKGRLHEPGYSTWVLISLSATGPFQASEGVSVETLDKEAKTGNLDAYLKPLEVGLDDLPEVRCLQESVVKLRNGNPGSVIASDVEYGAECWASYDGQAIAVGTYRGGEIHPTRVFVPGAVG